MNRFEKTKELLGYIKDGIDYETNAIVIGNDELSIVAEALEKQLNSRWIPVSERLPNYTSDYNVTVGVGSELGYFEEVRTYRYEIYNGKNPYRKWIIPNRFDEVIDIIAWKELPEKYIELN